MKNTLYLSILAAALMGGQVFADAIPTALEGCKVVENNFYYGVKKGDGEGDASGGNVSVSASATGSDLSSAAVRGGDSSQGGAFDNKVTMTGGQVSGLTGGDGITSASGNTVIMTGGSVSMMMGGMGGKDASGNIAIVAGDSVVKSTLAGGYILFGGDAANDNKIYLVGKGATATIADAQGNTATYTGGSISLGSVVGGRGPVSAGNSIDIYGTGITASNSVENMQILNFHISQNQIGGEDSMLTLTNLGMDLTNVTIGIQDVDVQAWTPGTTVTLVQLDKDKKTITGIESGQEVGIKRDDKVVAKGQLVLSNDNMTLSLSIPGSVPEPTTGTLSLLALAGLCARRRRK